MLPVVNLSKRIYSLPSILLSQGRFCSSRLPDLPEDEKLPLHLSQPNYRSPGTFDFIGLIHRTNWTWKELWNWREKKKMKKLRESQKFVAERHKILGPDLATTHFITFRGGRVRFRGSDKWVTRENIEKRQIPDTFTPNFLIEAVDASETLLCFEGISNFIHLRCIKELYLRNCSLIDDFCLHRLYVMSPTLEHLDISGCINVTERGICTLHTLRKLKKLVIHNTPRIAHRELVCLMLQDVLPKCDIEGVDYHNPMLLRRLKKYFEEDSDKLLENEKLKITEK